MTKHKCTDFDICELSDLLNEFTMTGKKQITTCIYSDLVLQCLAVMEFEVTATFGGKFIIKKPTN